MPGFIGDFMLTPVRRFVGTVSFLALAIFTGLSVAGTPSEAAFPGLNGSIACSGNRGPLLPSPPPTTGLSRQEIFSVNPDGSGEQVLTNNQRADLDPVYSPDGKRVAFVSARDTVAGEPSNPEIYVADNDGDLEGPDVQRLTYNRGQLASGALNAVAATDASPSWSPDGTQLVFHSGRETTFPPGPGAPNRFEVYTMSATPITPGVENPLTRLTENRVQDAGAEWSPDGSKIVYQTAQAQGTNFFNLEIFTMNPDGSDKTNVSNNPGTTPTSTALDNFPTWSPDSQHIAFASSRNTVTAGITNTEVWRMNRDGSNQTRLTLNLTGDTPDNDRDFDSAPHWSPDGRRILFNSGRESSPTAPVADRFLIFTMDANTGEAGGLQSVAETLIFANCSWQSVARPDTPPPPGNDPPLPPVPPSPFANCAALTANLIRGTTASESITGTPRGDRIFAGTGNDVVDGLAGSDCIDLGPGTDRGQGGDGADLILGGLGADRMSGNLGNDRLHGGSSGDRLIGGFGNDRLHGQSGSDRINAERGRDRVNGGSSNDVISAGSSGDRVAGDQGNDRINGNSGNDLLKGNSGRDRIKGSTGADRISSGSGNDRIHSRDGRRDRVTCGTGRDSVVADRSDRVSRTCERVRRGG